MGSCGDIDIGSKLPLPGGQGHGRRSVLVRSARNPSVTFRPQEKTQMHLGRVLFTRVGTYILRAGKMVDGTCVARRTDERGGGNACEKRRAANGPLATQQADWRRHQIMKITRSQPKVNVIVLFIRLCGTVRDRFLGSSGQELNRRIQLCWIPPRTTSPADHIRLYS